MTEVPEQKDFRESAASAAKREADRDSLFMKAMLRFPTTGEAGEVRIRNLSAGGVMAEAPVQVTRGEKIELELRNIGWITGTVAWIAEGRIGISFDYPVDAKKVRRPVGQSEQDLPTYLKKLDREQAQSKANMRSI